MIAASFHEAHKVDQKLVVARCDPSKLLELVEEALDEIALFVKMGVIRPLNLAVSLWRNDNLTALPGDLFVQIVCVVAFVCERRGCFKPVDEFVCASDVIFLARTSNEPDWIAKRIARSMVSAKVTPSGMRQEQRLLMLCHKH